MSFRPDRVSSDDLNAYIDGALPDADRAGIEQRFALDPVLQSDFEQLRATAMLLGSLAELTPRRSFRLGPEFARTASAPATDIAVRVLPIVRSLSVAAILVFMVVAGSLFFDIYGGTNDDVQVSYQEQDEVLGAGVTEPQPSASDDAEDAPVSAAPAAAEESGEDEESSMTARGDAASADADPMEDTSVDQSADVEVSDVEPEATRESSNGVGQAAESGTTDRVAPSSDEDRTSWVWSSVVLGGLALALIGLWLVLAQVGRQSRAGKS